MTIPEYKFLRAVASLLEYKSGPEGERRFVLEPLFLVAKSFGAYLESLPDSEDKDDILNHYNEWGKKVVERLAPLYGEYH